MSEESKKTNCPNCLGPAVKEGKTIICEVCDATFTFTKTGGAKVKEIGRLDNIEKRLDRLDSLLPGEEPQSDDKPVLPPEEQVANYDEPEESSILGD